MTERKKKEKDGYEVPLWNKVTLSLEEAVAYTGVARNKLCELADGEAAECVIWVGKKRLFKRRMLEEFLEKVYSI